MQQDPRRNMAQNLHYPVKAGDGNGDGDEAEAAARITTKHVIGISITLY